MQTVLAFTSKAIALSLLGLVLAYWTWAWVAPAPLPRATELSAPPGHLVAASGLFGGVQGEASAGTPSGLAVELLGVIAGHPEGSGYAILRFDARETRVVRAGGDLAPGVRVESVLPQRVILQRHGTRETLVWPHSARTSAAAPKAPVR